MPKAKRRRAAPIAVVYSCAHLLAATPAQAALPTYDKIVLVIEENHSFASVLKSGAAPYLTSLAAAGASFESMFGITHPSQPNYLHLFSGAHQSVYDNELAASAPFTTPNLGAAIRQAGGTFVGYSESMPYAGYTEVDANDGAYARRHNPWVNWQAAVPAANQLPASTNQPFTVFPPDFAQLPDLSIVVPNNGNNAHDGTLEEMDQWLGANLGAYAAWAPAHNSLLIVTFDEDEYASGNRIPLVLYGAHVPAGAVVRSTWTTHNLLRTLSDLYSVAPIGAAAQVQPLLGAFTGDPLARTVTFQQGTNAYAGAADTLLDATHPNDSFASAPTLQTGANATSQTLIRFDNLIGNSARLVPSGAQILSAKLLLHTEAPSSIVALHAMRTAWNDADTWTTLAAGVSADNVEASLAPEFTLDPNYADADAIFDVTASVQAWALGGAPNLGWLLNSTFSGLWPFSSAESLTAANRPRLEITYKLPGDVADFNNDGAVNSLDLAEWKTTFATPSSADANFDAATNGADFLLWQQHLGAHAVRTAADSVPEPSALGLIALACTIARLACGSAAD